MVPDATPFCSGWGAVDSAGAERALPKEGVPQGSTTAGPPEPEPSSTPATAGMMRGQRLTSIVTERSHTARSGGRTAGTSEPQAESAARFWNAEFAQGDDTADGTEWILPAGKCLPLCTAAEAASTLVIGCGDSDLSAQLHDTGPFTG